MYMPRASIPAEPSKQAFGDDAPTFCFADVAFHGLQRVGLCDFLISGLSSTAYTLAVYAS